MWIAHAYASKHHVAVCVAVLAVPLFAIPFGMIRRNVSTLTFTHLYVPGSHSHVFHTLFCLVDTGPTRPIILTFTSGAISHPCSPTRWPPSTPHCARGTPRYHSVPSTRPRRRVRSLAAPCSRGQGRSAGWLMPWQPLRTATQTFGSTRSPSVSCFTDEQNRRKMTHFGASYTLLNRSALSSEQQRRRAPWWVRLHSDVGCQAGIVACCLRSLSVSFLVYTWNGCIGGHGRNVSVSVTPNRLDNCVCCTSPN